MWDIYIYMYFLIITDSKQKLKNIPNEPIDLEKWLDSILGD